MKTYEIWEEGFLATGQSAQAHYHGKIEANSFDEACIKLLGDKLDKDENQPDGYRRMSDGSLCIWACSLYDNEAHARKSFG